MAWNIRYTVCQKFCLFDRGRKSRLSPAPPPSEPDVRISRIRLSGWWFYLTRIDRLINTGCTRREQPMSSKEAILPFLFFDSTSGACQHSFQTPRWFGLRMLWSLSDPFSRKRQSNRVYFHLVVCHASTFLSPLAPYPLRYFCATMETLTPVSLSPDLQVSLVHMARPSLHSVTNHLTRSVIAFSLLPTQRDGLPGALTFASSAIQSASRSGLRHSLAGSPLCPAESCSLSYGLQVRLRLLSTPPHGDAVTFSYRERASPGRGLSPLRSRLLSGALGADLCVCPW